MSQKGESPCVKINRSVFFGNNLPLYPFMEDVSLLLYPIRLSFENSSSILLDFIILSTARCRDLNISTILEPLLIVN